MDNAQFARAFHVMHRNIFAYGCYYATPPHVVLKRTSPRRERTKKGQKVKATPAARSGKWKNFIPLRRRRHRRRSRCSSHGWAAASFSLRAIPCFFTLLLTCSFPHSSTAKVIFFLADVTAIRIGLLNPVLQKMNMKLN